MAMLRMSTGMLLLSARGLGHRRTFYDPIRIHTVLASYALTEKKVNLIYKMVCLDCIKLVNMNQQQEKDHGRKIWFQRRERRGEGLARMAHVSIYEYVHYTHKLLRREP